ncbi:MAG: cupin domain-containing protein [Chitinophagaceae bacterium]|nr:cupin domain-containing protein [Chitinophagaceae bacterium]
MPTTVKKLIDKFDLLPHPEGGYFKETYRSAETIPAAALPDRFSANRHFSTAIYFLLEAGNFSAFHKIKSDECWHFYSGKPLLVHVIQLCKNPFHHAPTNHLLMRLRRGQQLPV